MSEVTRSQLIEMNKLHRKELRQIEKMSERQFQAFKKNFSFGMLENITKAEAHSLLMSMLTVNLKLQSAKESEKEEVPGENQ
ncbi:MAG: hypothetical protein M0R31_07955 [Candidatus Riflebacteria bacterium]|jgi:hypothetical protein|nr:hypothetical protein [Candidatus Riflebacteria bacterium]NLV93162.1 hypothetical protein [Candidatus Riflebacteria bacterium]